MKAQATLMVMVGLLLTSCIGTGKAARDEALLPAVRLAWGDSNYGVRADTLRGIEDATEDGDLSDPSAMLAFVDALEEAIVTENSTLIGLSPWGSLKGYAERGIDDRVEDGEMIEQAAAFLRRRLTNFDDAISKLSETGYVSYNWPAVPTRTDLRSREATPQGKIPVVAVVTN